jgi:hypothetical protein
MLEDLRYFSEDNNGILLLVKKKPFCGLSSLEFLKDHEIFLHL